MEPGFPVAMVFDLATYLGAVGTVGHLLICVDLSRLGFSVRLSGWCKQSVFFHPNHLGEESSECSSHCLTVEQVAKNLTGAKTTAAFVVMTLAGLWRSWQNLDSKRNLFD